MGPWSIDEVEMFLKSETLSVWHYIKTYGMRNAIEWFLSESIKNLDKMISKKMRLKAIHLTTFKQ